MYKHAAYVLPRGTPCGRTVSVLGEGLEVLLLSQAIPMVALGGALRSCGWNFTEIEVMRQFIVDE